MATLDPALLKLLKAQFDQYGAGGRVVGDGDTMLRYGLAVGDQRTPGGGLTFLDGGDGSWANGLLALKDNDDGRYNDIFNSGGQHIGRWLEESSNVEAREVGKIIAAALAGGYLTGGETAGAGSGFGNGAFLGEGVASGVPAWDAAASGAGLAGGGSAAAGNWSDWVANELAGAASNPATSGQLNNWAANSGISHAANGGSLLSNVQNLPRPPGNSGGNGGGSPGLMESLGGAKTVAGLLGAAAGAAAGGDQEQSTTRDPWKPAQPLLQDVINNTRTQFQNYTENPFSDAQKAAYGNQFGLLNAIQGMAPQLYAGANANASGANSYDRTNPRRSLTGSNTALNWNPMSLLAQFGAK